MKKRTLSSAVMGFAILTAGCGSSSPEVLANTQFECLEGSQYDPLNGAFQGDTVIDGLELTYVQPNEMTERTLWFRHQNDELEPFDAITKFELETYGC